MGLLRIVSMLVLVACTSTETGKAPTSSNNKTISIGTSSAPANFNPIDNTGLGGIDFNVASLMFPPLVNLKWTDGKPATADDTLFSKIELN